MGSRVLRLALLLVVLAPVGASGCGDDDDASSRASEGPAESTTEKSPAEAAEALEDTSVKPDIPKPTGSPPRRLQKVDIVKGKGPPAKPGNDVLVHYVGVSFSTGEQFDASWDVGQPYGFPLGGGAVIEGWDRGVVGMREGGRRQLTIPPELAYGAQGSPPAIGPNETLVFVIDMLEIR